MLGKKLNFVARLVGLALVSLIIPLTVTRAHTFGNGEADLTPPIVEDIKESQALKGDFGKEGGLLRGVFQEMDLWSAGSILKACFYDGDDRLKALVVKSAQKWLTGTSLSADFGQGPAYRACASGSTDDIRVTFMQKGYWSYVGTQSIQPSIIQAGASLNIETDGLPYERLNLPWIQEASLHELGHAFGLLHEHQSPNAKCGDEFDWPKIFAYAKQNWGWDEEEVRRNFAPYIEDPRLRATAYDRRSIMHYALSDWMFKRGKSSRCFIEQPKEISKTDRITILAAYPTAAAGQNEELKKRAKKVAAVMRDLNLNANQLAVAGVRLASSLTNIHRKLSLEFAVAEDDTVLRSGFTSLNACEGKQVKLSKTPTISCGVAPDGSGLVIEVDPDAKNQ